MNKYFPLHAPDSENFCIRRVGNPVFLALCNRCNSVVLLMHDYVEGVMRLSLRCYHTEFRKQSWILEQGSNFLENMGKSGTFLSLEKSRNCYNFEQNQGTC